MDTYVPTGETYPILLQTTDGQLNELTDKELYALYTVLAILTTPLYAIPDMPSFGVRLYQLKHKLFTAAGELDTERLTQILNDDIKRVLSDEYASLVRVYVKRVTGDEQQRTVYLEVVVELASNKSIPLNLKL